MMKRTIIISLSNSTLLARLAMARVYLKIVWLILVEGKARYSVDTEIDLKPFAPVDDRWLEAFVSMDTYKQRTNTYRCIK